MATRFTHPHRYNHGFTLVEMVMTIVIVGIVAAILAPILSTTVTGFGDARVRNELTAQSRIVLERLTREIREADPTSITIGGAGGSSLTYTQLTGLTGLVDLGSTFAKIYANGNTVNVRQNLNTLVWDDDNNVLTPNSLLATNLSVPNGIAFTYSPGTTINSGVVTVALALTDGNETISVYREIHIRNTQ